MERYKIAVAGTSSMCCEDVVEYSKSRQRMLDEREGLLYYGEEQHKEGRMEGIRETVAASVNRLRAQGMSVSQISATLGISNEEIDAIPSV